MFGIFSLLIPSYGQAAIYYVNDSDLTGDVYTSTIGSNSNNGTTANTPKATLTDVLSTYSGTFISGDTIFIDAGNYFTTDANLSFGSAISGVSIIGAGSNLTFFDNNNTSTDANRWGTVSGANITIQGIYLTGYNFGFGGASTLNISGATNLTITDIQVNENSAGGGASAIVITGGSSVDFIGGGSNCNPTGPSVAGGGVNIEGNGNLISFTDYTLTGNSKSLQGGSAMYISGDNTTFVTVTNSTIADNINTSSQGGAGVYLSGANLTISGSCITGNSTHSGIGPKYGGGITLTRGSTLIASNCNFANNIVSNSGKGGAISINTSFTGSGSTASATLTSCNFDNNSANSEGNHIYLRVGSSNAANVIIDECTFSTTSQDVRQDNSGTVTVTNSGTALTLSGSNITNNNTSPTTTATAFCPISTIPCFSVLPVELIEFHSICESGYPVISWTTASEKDNDYFILESAKYDGVFTPVITINGSGNSQNKIAYSYTDKQASAGNNYYRLTQVDFDGKRETFDIISSQNCVKYSKTIIHYSSENQNLVLINSDRNLSGLTELTVISTIGQTIFSHHFNTFNKEKGEISLQNPLPLGSYLVRITYKNREEIVKIIVH
jgi:hypothetical protein